MTNAVELIRRGAPLDLCFQSIAGTEKANASFGIDLALLDEAWHATLELGRGTVGDDVMYFETGQGSALSANAYFGVDQQTIECRAYAVARRFRPLLVNTVVGFIGPEYLFNGKQIIRAGLEDHCCGKLLGLPMHQRFLGFFKCVHIILWSVCFSATVFGLGLVYLFLNVTDVNSILRISQAVGTQFCVMLRP